MSPHPQYKKPGRPKAGEITKPLITDEKVRELLNKGWSRRQICKNYYIGRARATSIMDEMRSEEATA